MPEFKSMLKPNPFLCLTASALAFWPLAASAHPGVAAHPKTLTARTQTPTAPSAHAPRAHFKSIPAHRTK